jgi:hypothetical protein
MTIFYISTTEILNRDYTVEANSKKEAKEKLMKLVLESKVNHYDEDLIKITIDKDSVKTHDEELNQ